MYCHAQKMWLMIQDKLLHLVFKTLLSRKNMFGLFFILLILPVIIAAAAAYIIFIITRNKLRKTGNPRVKLISTLTLIGSFVIILAAILTLIAFNLRIER